MTESSKTPPPAPEKSNEIVLRLNPKLIFGALGALAVLILAGAALVGLALMGFCFYKLSPASPATASHTPFVRTESDYAAWKSKLQLLGIQKPATPTATGTIGFFDRLLHLPGDGMVRDHFAKRLPPDLELSGIEPLHVEKEGENLAITYRLTLHSRSALSLLPVIDETTSADKTLPREKPLRQLLVLADDLPPGLSYRTANAIPVYTSGESIPLEWKARRVAKVDGHWQVLEAEVLPVETAAADEMRLLREAGTTLVYLLRSDSQKLAADNSRQAALQAFNARMASIQKQVEDYRANALANDPEANLKVVDRESGSGSGTPTSMGIGTLAGAALGAGIGGAAGGGDGAAIGAGAGAGAGLLGGFLAGREHENREMSRANARRNRARSAINAHAETLWAQLVQQYHDELHAAAQLQLLRLKNLAGN